MALYLITLVVTLQSGGSSFVKRFHSSKETTLHSLLKHRPMAVAIHRWSSLEILSMDLFSATELWGPSNVVTWTRPLPFGTDMFPMTISICSSKGRFSSLFSTRSTASITVSELMCDHLSSGTTTEWFNSGCLSMTRPKSWSPPFALANTSSNMWRMSVRRSRIFLPFHSSVNLILYVVSFARFFENIFWPVCRNT